MADEKFGRYSPITSEPVLSAQELAKRNLARSLQKQRQEDERKRREAMLIQEARQQAQSKAEKDSGNEDLRKPAPIKRRDDDEDLRRPNRTVQETPKTITRDNVAVPLDQAIAEIPAQMETEQRVLSSSLRDRALRRARVEELMEWGEGGAPKIGLSPMMAGSNIKGLTREEAEAIAIREQQGRKAAFESGRKSVDQFDSNSDKELSAFTTSAGASVVGPVADILGFPQYAQETQAAAAGAQAAMAEHRGETYANPELAGDVAAVANTAVQMVPGVAAGLVAGPNVGLGVMAAQYGAQTYSEAAYEAAEAGLAGDGQDRYAKTQTAITMAVMPIFNMIPGMAGLEGRVLGMNLGRRVMGHPSIRRALMDGAKTVTKDLAAEVAEEVTDSLLGGVAKEKLLNQPVDYKQILTDTIRQTVMTWGTVTGAQKIASRMTPSDRMTPDPSAPAAGTVTPSTPTEDPAAQAAEPVPVDNVTPEILNRPAVQEFMNKPQSARTYEAAVKAGMDPIPNPNREGRARYADDLRRRFADPVSRPAAPLEPSSVDRQIIETPSGAVPDGNIVPIGGSSREESIKLPQEQQVQQEAYEGSPINEGRQEELLTTPADSRIPPADHTRESFEKEYTENFLQMMELPPDDPGYQALESRMADLYDAHPDWAQNLETTQPPPSVVGQTEAGPDQSSPPATGSVSSEPKRYPSAIKRYPAKVPDPYTPGREYDAPPVYLTGVSNDQSREAAKSMPNLGVMLTPRTQQYKSHLNDYQFFGVDNGAFTGKFNEKAFYKLLDDIREQGDSEKALFAAAPDVVGDWQATLKASEPHLDRIRDAGFPVALVLQNGATPDTIPWDRIDALFVGGDNNFKLAQKDDSGRIDWNAEMFPIIKEAEKRDVPIHFGRVNSAKRLEMVHFGMKGRSADGTFLKFGNPDQQTEKVMAWLRPWGKFPDAKPTGEPALPTTPATPSNSNQLPATPTDSPVPAFAALPQKSQDLFNKAFESKAVEQLKQMVDKSNVAWNKEFERRTGVKLPRTLKDRYRTVMEWANPTPTYGKRSEIPKWGIYQTMSQGKPKFSVKESDNDKGFGDSLHDTAEEAKKYADIGRQRETERAEAAAKRQAAEEADQKKQQDHEASFQGFLTDDPMVKGRRLKTLDTLVNYEKKPITRKALVEQRVADGWTVNDKNEFQAPTGEFLDAGALTKTGIDYARHLVNLNPAAEETVSPEQFEQTIRDNILRQVQPFLSQKVSKDAIRATFERTADKAWGSAVHDLFAKGTPSPPKSVVDWINSTSPKSLADSMFNAWQKEQAAESQKPATPAAETPAEQPPAVEYPENGPVVEDWFGSKSARVLEWTKTVTPGKLKRKDYAAVYRDGKRIAAGLVELASGNMIDILSDGKIQRFFQGDKGNKFAVGIARQRKPEKPVFNPGKPMTRDTVFADAPKPEQTLRGQKILPGMTGRAEEIDRSEFVRKHQSVLLEDMRELVDDEEMLDALREPVGNILKAVWNGDLKETQDLYDTDLGNDSWTALTAMIAYHAPKKREAGLESLADEAIRRAFTHRDAIKPKVAEKSAEPTESDIKAGVRAELARQLAEEAAAAKESVKPKAKESWGTAIVLDVGAGRKPKPTKTQSTPKPPRTKTGEKLGKLSEDTGVAAKQAWEDFLKGMKGMPLNSTLGPFNKDLAKMTVTMVRAQVADKVVKFADLVARIVEYSSPSMARNLSDYLEAAWDILGETDSRLDPAGKVADVLGPEKEETNEDRSERDESTGDGGREAAGRPLGETPVEEPSSDIVSTDEGGRDTGRSGDPSGARSGGEESGTVPERDEAAGSVPASPAGDDRTAGRRGRIDFRITGEDQIGVKFNFRERFEKNVEAIKVLKQVESENRRATPEEQKVLVQYVGWGGLKEAFSTRADQGLREKAILKDLLTEQELAQARTSVRNAHYTSPEVISAMWEGLTDAGFAGGRILEPSAGIGHFYGLVPESVAEVSKLSGIEMDGLTARIAQQLYQTADITHAPYQDVNVKNLQDLVISNVPFGPYKAMDKYNKALKKKSSIHNFFFLKAMTNVRPGGVIAFITSRYTMDGRTAEHMEVREQITAGGGRFVGAVRLPNNAFMGIAKTKVTTDVIFIQKDAGDAQSWINTKEDAGGFIFNEYFHDHPENVLGKIDPKGGTQIGEWGIAPDGHDIGKELAEKIAAMPFDRSAMAENSTEDSQAVDDVSEDSDVPDGRLAIRNNKLFKAVGGKLEEVPLWGGERGQERKFAIIREMGKLAAVRDRLSDLETSSLATDAEIERARKLLNREYDRFVQEHGFVHKQENQGLFRPDEQLPTLLALEEWDTDTKTAKKADVFEKRVQQPDGSASTPTTAEGAAVESYARLGRIDLPLMAEWLGKSEAQVEADLTGWAYKDPGTGEWSLKNVYLSGNIAKKLKEAEAAAKKDPAYQKNVDDLKRVLPPRKTAGQIHVRARSPFVKGEQYVQFMQHLGVNGVVRHDDITGAWLIDNPHISDPVKAGTWGVGEKSAADLLHGLLNNKPPVVWGKDPDGNRIVNEAATQLARAKAKEIEDEFGKWIFSDPDRAKQIEDSFNDTVGAFIEGEWDGSHLTLPGMNINISLLPHQKNAIWRAIVTGNILLAHEVGLGKTFIMAAIAMERKRLGLATNQMFVVPNHLLSQWASEFKALYPSAKLLALESDQINSKNRRTLMERVKSGRFDAIIVTPEAYKKMPMSNDIVEAKLKEITEKIENTIKEAKKAKGDNKNFVAKLESVLESIRGKMEAMLNDPAKDAGAKFDELGIDSIYVDEAHEYRNLWSMTQMGDISGVGLEGNQKTFDMLLKTDYLNQKTNGRGIVFATGTPIANSISELYSMQRYLQPKTLAEAGVASFDDWANTFGEAVTDIEVDPTGSGFRSKTRFKEFRNTIALSKIFRQVADVKYADDPDVRLDKVRPKLREGKLQTVQIMPSLGLLGYVRDLVRRLEISKKRNFDKRIDNPLKVTTDGRKAALDMRLVVPEEDSISSKINHAVENVARIYREEGERKGAQLMWVNLGTPASVKKKKAPAATTDPDADPTAAKMDSDEANMESGRINAYEDIKRKLIAQGIPENEIAFIHDHDDKDRKRALFQKVREGKVRILISTVKKLATGANIQTRLVAMHFLDPPWKPADIEQALGRAIRRGNLYKDWGGVQGFTYVTRGSFDAYIWQLLENKAKAIKQIMRGESDSVEDTGRIELNADEVKALASSNPKVLELVRVRNEAGQLRAEYYGHRQEIGNVQSEIAYRTGVIKRLEDDVIAAEAEIAKLPSRDDLHSNFTVKIGKKEYSKRSEIGAAIAEALPVITETDKDKRQKLLDDLSQNPVLIGSAYGTKIYAGRSSFDGTARLVIQGYRLEMSENDTANGVKLFNYFDKKYDEPRTIKENISKNKQQLEALKLRADQKWPKEDRLKAAEESLNQLEKELGSAAGDKNALPVVSALTKFAIMAEKLGRMESRPVTFDGKQWIHGDRMPVRAGAVTAEMERAVDNEVSLMLSDSKEVPHESFFFRRKPVAEETEPERLRREAEQAQQELRQIQAMNEQYNSVIAREWKRSTSATSLGSAPVFSKEMFAAVAGRALGSIRAGAKRFEVMIRELRAEHPEGLIVAMKPNLIAVWNSMRPKFGLEDVATDAAFDTAIAATGDADLQQATEAAIAASTPTPDPETPPAATPDQEPLEPDMVEEPERTYSLKNAATDAERESLGMPPRRPNSGPKWAETAEVAASLAKTDYGRTQVDNLIAELGTRPRATTPTEHFQLLQRYAEVSEKYKEARDERNAAKRIGDAEQEAISEREMLLYESQKTELVRIESSQVSYLLGAGLAARRASITEDFTIEELILDYESAFGRKLDPENPKDKGILESMRKRIAELEAGREALRQMVADRDAQINDLETRLKEAHDAAVAAASSAPPVSAAKKRAQEKVSERWKAISALLGKSYSIETALAQGTKAFIDLAGAYVELGVVSLTDYLNRVRKRMGPDAEPLIPQFTEGFKEYMKSVASSGIDEITGKIDLNDDETIGKAARDLHRMVIQRDGLDASADGRNAAVVAVYNIMKDYVEGITEEQVARAMSGIGVYAELNKDEIEVIRRDQKAQLLLLQQIRDWNAGQAPPATGMERPPISDEQRALRKVVNEAKKAAGIVTATEGQLRSALDAAKRMVRNRISDLDKALKPDGKPIERSKRVSPTDPELDALRAERDDLQKRYNEVFGKNNLSDEQRLNMAEKLLDRAIDNLEADLKAGKLYAATKKPAMSSPAIEAKREQLEALKASREEMRIQSGEAQQRSDAAFERHLLERGAELARRLAEKDFAPAPKNPERAYTPEMLKQMLANKKMEQDFIRQKKQWEFQNLHPIRKLWATYPGAAMGIWRSAMLSFEMSPIGRQGRLLGGSHPQIYLKAISKAFASNFWKAKSIFPTEQDLFDTQTKLEADKEAVRLEQIAKLEITDVNNGGKHEEGYQDLPDVVRKLWGYAGAERSSVAFLNTQRRMVFRTLVSNLAMKRDRNGEPALSNADLRVIGNAVNLPSGRADIGRWMRSLEGLSRVFLAPRWVASRVLWWLGEPVWHESLVKKGEERASADVRKAVAIEWGKQAFAQATVIGFVAGSLYAMFGAPGDDEEWDFYWDPRHKYFGHIRVGNRYTDMTAGLAQYLSAAVRIAGGTQIKRWETEETDKAQVAGSMLQGKLAPVPSILGDYLFGPMTPGVEFGSKEWAAGKFTPLFGQEVVQAFKGAETPSEKLSGAWWSWLAFLGQSSRVFEARTKQRQDLANELRVMRKQGVSPEKIQKAIDDHLKNAAKLEARQKLRIAETDQKPALEKVVAGDESGELEDAKTKERFDIVTRAAQMLSSENPLDSQKSPEDPGIKAARDLLKAMAPTEAEAIELYNAAYRRNYGSTFERVDGRMRPKRNVVAARRRLRAIYSP